MSGIHTDPSSRRAKADASPAADTQTPADRYQELFVEVQRTSVFEDTKYLRAGFEGLRSLRERFRDHFGVDRKHFIASYISLWMCAMRNYDRLSDNKFSKGRQTNRNQEKDVPSAPISRTHLVQLVNLAVSKGFQSKESDSGSPEA